MKKFTSLLLVLVLVCSCVIATGCQPGETVTVTFVYRNGQENTTAQIGVGSKIKFPSTPTSEYGTFNQWCLDEKGENPWDKATAVTEPITLYASWTRNNDMGPNVTFNFNFEDASPKASTIKNYVGFTLLQPTIPERECYVFTGWYKTADCEPSQRWNELEIIEGTKGKTLYAGWELEENHKHSWQEGGEHVSSVVVTVDPTCVKAGYDEETCACGEKTRYNEVDALGHHFDMDEEDFFRLVLCSNAEETGCTQVRRLDSENNYAEVFVFTFDAERQTEIEEKYAAILANLDAAADFDPEAEYGDATKQANDAFEVLYDDFYEEIMYVTEQYQYAYVFYSVAGDEAGTPEQLAYENISNFRTKLISDFYALYRLVYETEYRNFFFSAEDGWTQDEIDQALILSDSYGNDDYVDLNNQADAILTEFRAIDSSSDRVLELYEDFVSINNQIAALAGYDNYVEYAYENVYDRDYSPADVATMRGYVSQYLKDVYQSVYESYRAASTNFSGKNGEYYAAFTNSSIFDNRIVSEAVGDYLELLYSEDYSKVIDFYHEANLLFRNGNYFKGAHEGAFSYYIPAQDATILYFGPFSYSGAFTFVHEFGHYYNNIYNPGVSIAMDLDETQSQGNEALFMAFLKGWLGRNGVSSSVYNSILYDQLFNNLAIVMLATAVDEFEQSVYTNSYFGSAINRANFENEDGEIEYGPHNYQALFEDIMARYGINGTLNSSYWRFVVIEAPCYYISYAMSQLPCIEILAIATSQEEGKGFDVAKESYLKLFAFTDSDDLAHTDEYGDRVVDATLSEIYAYCGLGTPFESGLYQTIKSVFGE